MGIAGVNPFAPEPESDVRRWAVIAVVAVLFVLTLVLQGVTQWQAMEDEAARSGTTLQTDEFWWAYLAGVFTAWQAAFLVVLTGALVLGWVLTRGRVEHSPQIVQLHHEIERLQARVETLAEDPSRNGSAPAVPATAGAPRRRSPWRRVT